MGAAFGGAATLAAAALAAFGANERGTDIALQVTARFSFLLFWLAYTGAGLVALLGPTAQPLKRHGRDFGLAFASAHLVHVGLLVWLCWIGAAPVTGVFLFFGPPLACVYLLVLFSLRRLQQAFGPSVWWWLRTLAMNYVAYAFATDFLKYPFTGGVKHVVEYLPFAALCVVGPLLHFYPVLPPLERLR
jgi:hypothetical protein